MSRRRSPLRGGISFYLIAFLVIFLVSILMTRGGDSQEMPYSALVGQINSGNVRSAVVQGDTIEVIFDDSVDGQLRASKAISPYWMDDLLNHLEQARVDYETTYDYNKPVDLGLWMNLLLMLLMFGSMAFFIWLMFSRQSGEGKNAMSFGRSKAKIADPTKNKVTFGDVAGADEEKEELTEVVDFLKNPHKYTELGAKIPKGILLIGPPGTGKTLLARAVAGEAGVPFFSISGSDFVEMFVGVGASRVRDLFEQAKKHSPSIIFIDEIDAVGRQRGTGMGGSHDEREQTLNQLLVEMDGFGPNEGTIVIAATNRADILDPALLRPGRFDRRVQVMRPDMKGREEILHVHARNKPIDNSVDFREIARETPGFTGADLANLLNEAALLAVRKGQRTIEYEDISESVFKVMIGPEKRSRVMSDHERNLTAYHEAGHAIILRTASETNRVERVSIIPTGGAGGYTAHKPHEDMYYATKKQLEANIMVALGGRAAEEIIFNEISTGASNDLQQINSIARDMVTRYGMSDRLLNMVYGSADDEVFLGRDYGHVKNYSDDVASIIDEEIKDIIESCYAQVLQILNEKREALEAVTEALLENEKITGAEFEELYITHTTPEQRQNDASNRGLDEIFGRRKKKLTDEKIPVTIAPDNSDEVPESSPDQAYSDDDPSSSF